METTGAWPATAANSAGSRTREEGQKGMDLGLIASQEEAGTRLAGQEDGRRGNLYGEAMEVLDGGRGKVKSGIFGDGSAHVGG